MMDTLPPEYFQFWILWENGEYFECHEVLEIAWRREQNPNRKAFFQGLIHCAVALVHLERNNKIGARGQLKKAQSKLERFGAEYSGCDIGAILKFVADKLDEEFKPRMKLENFT